MNGRSFRAFIGFNFTKKNFELFHLYTKFAKVALNKDKVINHMDRTLKIAPVLVSLALLTFLISVPAVANNSAVVLQYHNVGVDTPDTTSISPKTLELHIQWLKDNNFTILPLSKVVSTLRKKKEFKTDRVVAITFDDANISVCDTAWPILKKHKIPFTLFISTESIERKFTSQCSWENLKEMVKSGLMTPANHSHQHLNMVSGELFKSPALWRSTMHQEIAIANDLIASNLGIKSSLFAYPYGEYNAELSSLVTQLGFTGFGQHSGAIGHLSDFSALPRFPASGQHANLDTLSVKLLSLPFPAKYHVENDNPISINGKHNPPKLIIETNDPYILKNSQCFNAYGERMVTVIEDNNIVVQAPSALSAGRHRYTCTCKSPNSERFFWLSQQWLIE